jgi:hypothetical protein
MKIFSHDIYLLQRTDKGRAGANFTIARLSLPDMILSRKSVVSYLSDKA